MTSHTTVFPEQVVSRQSLKPQTNIHSCEHKNSPEMISNISKHKIIITLIIEKPYSVILIKLSFFIITIITVLLILM
jgi:hypothetical protein